MGGKLKRKIERIEKEDDEIKMIKKNKKVNCISCLDYLTDIKVPRKIMTNFLPIFFYHLETFHCIDCGQTFSRNDNLKRHSRVHMNHVKSVECPECKKTFGNNTNLKTHFESLHKGTEPKTPVKSVYTYNKGFSFES